MSRGRKKISRRLHKDQKISYIKEYYKKNKKRLDKELEKQLAKRGLTVQDLLDRKARALHLDRSKMNASDIIVDMFINELNKTLGGKKDIGEKLKLAETRQFKSAEEAELARAKADAWNQKMAGVDYRKSKILEAKEESVNIDVNDETKIVGYWKLTNSDKVLARIITAGEYGSPEEHFEYIDRTVVGLN